MSSGAVDGSVACWCSSWSCAVAAADLATVVSLTVPVVGATVAAGTADCSGF